MSTQVNPKDQTSGPKDSEKSKGPKRSPQKTENESTLLSIQNQNREPVSLQIGMKPIPKE